MYFHLRMDFPVSGFSVIMKHHNIKCNTLCRHFSTTVI